MQTAETLLAIYGERGRHGSARPSSSASDATSRSTPDDRRGHTRIRRNQSKDRATGEPDDAKVCAAERGVESLTQSGGARRNAPGSSD